MGWGNSHHGHKKTMVCPLKKCKYTSRHFIMGVGRITRKNSVSSIKCPIHREILIDKYLKL